MTPERLEELLQAMRSVKLAIVGDFFLDQYMIIDQKLSERSIETGLEAYQVVELRPSPGAAGSVSTKVAALEVGTAYAVTMLGDDGNGYELMRQLRAIGLRLEHVVQRTDRFTPTYGKPVVRRENGSEIEINRIDVKNRRPLPAEVEAMIVGSIRSLADEVHGIIVIDQVEQRNCGVVSDAVREELVRLGRERPELRIFADSRSRIGAFRNIMLKPNIKEAAKALARQAEPANGAEPVDAAAEMALKLAEACGRAVFLTIGPGGIVAAHDGAAEHVPTYPVRGPIDTTGAGDTVTAGIVASLCAGASIREAAEVGNLAASITITQFGATGTATQQQMRDRLAEAVKA